MKQQPWVKFFFLIAGLLLALALLPFKTPTSSQVDEPTNLSVTPRPAIDPISSTVEPTQDNSIAEDNSNRHPTKPFAKSNFGEAWKSDSRAPFADFRNWTERYLADDSKNNSALVESGVEIARIRREEMLKLIESDPALAIASAVPMVLRSQLPATVRTELEEYISGAGDLSLEGVTPAPGRKVLRPYSRTAKVGGKYYDAYVYGRRETQASKVDISIQGIALDGKIAVSESPLRILEVGETPMSGKPLEAVCPISGTTTPIAEAEPLNLMEPAAIEFAGRIQQLCSADHVGLYETKLIGAEDGEPLSLNDGGPGTSNITGRPPISRSQGEKKVIVIRIDFSDLPGTPSNPFDGQSITEDYVVNRFNNANGVRDFFEQGSYGKTTLTIAPTSGGDSPDVTQVLRMPNTAAYYATGGHNTELHDAAKTLASDAGYVLDNYDLVGVVFSYLGNISNSQISYGGRGTIQGERFWINGYFTLSTVAHEIGHNYGLQHANLWTITDGNPVSPTGTSLEYGDIFDVMGDGESFENQFNHWEKNLLQWIPDTAVQTVSSGGTYRVYRFDDQNANLGSALALKVVRNNARDYWIGFRQAITGNSSLMNGAYVMWGYNSVQQSDLLDLTTPGSNPNDAALALGSTFNDSTAGIMIQPIAKGGTAPNQYLDIQITFQPRISWSSTSYTFDEQLGMATVTLLRSGSSNGIVTVNFTTATNTATSPADYTHTNGIITWANGDMTAKTISVPLVPDTFTEGVETFVVNLTSISGGVAPEGSTTTVSIADSGAFDASLNEDFVNNTIEDVIVQPDGKLLISGSFSGIYVDFDLQTRGGIARLNANGTLDQEFATQGGANATPVNNMVLQTDGKVLICGNFSAVHGAPRNRVARLHTDGSIDSTFDPGVGPDNEVEVMALQPDGKILIGGYFANVQGTGRRLLARLDSDGSLDTSFAAVNFGAGSGWRVESLALLPNGKILAGGSFYFSGAQTKAGIALLNSNGSVDSSFNPGGGSHVNGSTSNVRSVLAISPQPDGSILIGGNFTAFNSTPRNYIARLTSTGQVDGSFNPDADGTVYTTMVQADGKILAGGNFTTIAGTSLNRFARLDSGGAVDAGFDVGAGSQGRVMGFAMQPDGKLLLCSDFGSVKGVSNRTLSRLYAGLPALSGTVQLTAADFTGAEGSSASLTVSRTGGTYGAISINYATITGTAGTTDFTTNAGTLSWPDGHAANKTISIALTNDGIAESEEVFLVNLGIPFGGTFLSSPGQATVTINTGFDLWSTTYFTPLELQNSEISGAGADPDGDGLTNLEEYAAHRHPRLADATNNPIAGIHNVTGTNFLTLTFRRNNSAPDLAYTVQAVGALGSTFTNGPIQVGSVTNHGDGTETITWRDTIPATSTPHRFMHLKATRVP